MIEDVTQQIDKFFADGAIAVSGRYWHLRIELNIRELTNIITFSQRNNQGKTTFFQRNGMMICHKSGATQQKYVVNQGQRGLFFVANQGQGGGELSRFMTVETIIVHLRCTARSARARWQCSARRWGGAKLRILMGIGEGGGRVSKQGIDDAADAANEIERQIYQLELFALRCCCTVDGKWLGPNSYCNINIGIIHKHL